jgi:carboxypeptidase Taq
VFAVTPTYDSLRARWQRLHHYSHLVSIASVDRNTHMPPAGNEARSAAMAELEGEMHRLRTDPGLEAALNAAASEPLDAVARANLREMRRDWFQANALPTELVERKSRLGARCEHAWRAQRHANDWHGFLHNFRPVLAAAREEAELLAQASGLSRYDALLDRFEPGMRAARVDAVFADLKSWLPSLLREVVARQHQAGTPLFPEGPFRREAQVALGRELMEVLGFDFSAGRLDESAHPFCGGVPEDVRLTTRYRDDDALQCVMGVIHETGHARYEQNLPREWLGQPLAWARSMALHESQSLSFEMQLARSAHFAPHLSALLVKHHGAQDAFAPDNLKRLLTRVAPGRIRVDADEVTYPLHVILRYEIERALVEGEMGAEAIPQHWNARMREWLGIDTTGDYANGCLQDVHWSEGLFGYFPCYTLGAMYAAQWFASLRSTTPDLDARIARGDFAVVFDWLKTHIWHQGSRWETDELARRASGSVLDPAHFRRHLEARYLG